jgi:hypothetical protein
MDVLTKLSLPRNIELFPAREILVSDIPAGDGKIANVLLECKNGSLPPFLNPVNKSVWVLFLLRGALFMCLHQMTTFTLCSVSIVIL